MTKCLCLEWLLHKGTSQCPACHLALLRGNCPSLTVSTQSPRTPSSPFSECVSFKSISSISNTHFYSNAIRRGIKGASIICIARHLSFMAFEESTLTQTNGITPLLFMEKYNPSLSYCAEKLPSQLGEERTHLYYFTLADRRTLGNRRAPFLFWKDATT